MKTDKFYSAKITNTKIIAFGVIEISLQVEKKFDFIPGQYIWLEIPKLLNPDNTGNRRAFSISNLPNSENILKIIFRASTSGFKQSLSSLEVGEEVNIVGPFGMSFCIDTHTPKNLIFLAGGTGVAPFLSVISDIFINQKNYTVHLFWSNKGQSIPFKTEIEQLFSRVQNSNLYFIDSSPTWEQCQSAIQESGDDYQIWISGPKGYVNKTYNDLCIGGVSTNKMVFENYYPDHQVGLSFEDIQSSLRTESVLSQAIQSSSNHIIITDPNGVIIFANKATENLTGFKLEELLGNTPRLWGGLMSKSFYQQLWQKKTSGEPFDGEIINRKKNGEIYTTIAHISPIKNQNQQVIGFIGTEEDVTERNRLADELLKSKSFLDSIINNIPSIVLVKDAKNFQYLMANKSLNKYFSLNQPNVTGKTDFDLYPENLAKTKRDIDTNLVMVGQSPPIVEEHLSPDHDQPRLFRTQSTLIKNSQNEPLYILSVSEDITEEKTRTDEIEKMNKLMVGRELKMIELKKQIETLLGKNV